MTRLLVACACLAACDSGLRFSGGGGEIRAAREPGAMRLYIPIEADGESYTALVDTGATCALPGGTRKIARVTVGGVATYTDVLCADANIAVIGNDMLGRFASTLDARAATVTLTPSPVAPRGSTLRLQQSALRAIIIVEVEGRPLRLLVDSGASMTVLREHFVSMLAADGRPAAKIDLVFDLIDKDAHPCSAIRVDSTKVGAFEVKGLPVAAEEGDGVLDLLSQELDAPIDGLLGMDFLREFRVTVDFPAAWAIFEQNGAIGILPDPFCRFPLAFGRRKDDDRTVYVVATTSDLEEWLGAEVTEIDGKEAASLSDDLLFSLGYGPKDAVRTIDLGLAGKEATLTLAMRDALGAR